MLFISSRLRQLSVAALAAAALTSCDDPHAPTTRERRASDGQVRHHASSNLRFNDNLGIDWTTPPGWQQAARTEMRMLNFTIRGENGQTGECYLASTGGSELDNVNRWRKQMALPDLTEADLQQLPFKPLFGQSARFIDLAGTYSGMGAAPLENYRVLAVIRSNGGMTLSVKLTGPAELVAQHLTHFDTFCASLRL